ncbi:hypothetical protein Acid345_2777 [Candidatus Koribacter versatilis Ellin345]|uniref:Rhs family protein n=1 Tax=Koribacter versatilis (strain Ellin345) TaxID=204669 RepID=Q1IMX2_KORVE|nr:hypothetical protein Acid345_2777 [Candidatus Koribacter versatilis Ellin345]
MLARRDLPSGTVKYYFGDHLGSASVLTDIQGNIYKQYDYAPYGELHWQSGSDTNHYLFTGKERDTETGNDYFGAVLRVGDGKVHDAGLGSHTGADSIRETGATPIAEPIRLRREQSNNRNRSGWASGSQVGASRRQTSSDYEGM